MTIIEDIDKLYEKDFKKQLNTNKTWLTKNIDSESVSIKIKNFCDKYDQNFKTIKEKIKSDPIFALTFIKDPSKQNFYETTLLEWIKKLPIISNVKKLPSGGKNAKYLTNGQILLGKDIKDRKTVKSIDFEWEYSFNNKTLKFYASAKYTKLDGGAQDEQFNDLLGFAIGSLNYDRADTFLYALADGPYYQKEKNVKDTTIEYQTRVEYLNNAGGESFTATESKNLLNNVLKQIKKWLYANFSKPEADQELARIREELKEYKYENEDIKTISLIQDSKQKSK